MSPADALDADAAGERRCAVRRSAIASSFSRKRRSTNDVVFADGGARTKKDSSSSRNDRPPGADNTVGVGNRRAGKGLWFSVLLRPNVAPNESPRLTSWAAETIAATIADELALRRHGQTAERRLPPRTQSRGRVARDARRRRRAECRDPRHRPERQPNADDFPAELRATATSLAIAQRQAGRSPRDRGRAPARARAHLPQPTPNETPATPAASSARARCRSARAQTRSPRPGRAPIPRPQNRRRHSRARDRASRP